MLSWSYPLTEQLSLTAVLITFGEREINFVLWNPKLRINELCVRPSTADLDFRREISSLAVSSN